MLGIFKRIYEDFSVEDDALYNLSGGEIDKKTEKKLNNAQQAYADYSHRETPLLLFDNTVFGSAKEGFLLTDFALYSNDLDSGGVALEAIDDIRLKGSEMLLLDVSGNEIGQIELTLIDKKNRDALVHMLNMYRMALVVASPLRHSAIAENELAEKVVETLRQAQSAADIVPGTLTEDDFKPSSTKSAAAHYFNSKNSAAAARNRTAPEAASIAEQTATAEMTKRINPFDTFLLLAMTPIYLALVYYKTVMGADTQSLLLISALILVVYVPIGAAISDNTLPVSIHTVLMHTSISKYLYLVFGLIVLYLLHENVHLIHLNHKDTSDLRGVIALGIFSIWWLISGHLIKLATEGSDGTQLKMFFWVLFILSLIVIEFLPPLPSKISFMYFVELALSMLGVVVIGLLLVPQIGIKVFWAIFKAIMKDAIKTAFGSKKKRGGGSKAFDKNLEELAAPLLMVFLLYGMIFVPLINWFTSVTSSVDPFWTSVSITTIMILVSAFGVNFQLKLFYSYFWNDTKRTAKASMITLGVFYALILANIGYLHKLNENAVRIEQGQKTLERFNQNLQNSMRRQ